MNTINDWPLLSIINPASKRRIVNGKQNITNVYVFDYDHKLYNISFFVYFMNIS